MSIIYSNKMTFWICFTWAFIVWVWILGHFNCEKQMKIHRIKWIQQVVKCFFLLKLSKGCKTRCCVSPILPAPLPPSLPRVVYQGMTCCFLQAPGQRSMERLQPKQEGRRLQVSPFWIQKQLRQAQSPRWAACDCLTSVSDKCPEVLLFWPSVPPNLNSSYPLV